ncbi:MAG TPA: choice-of-anchor tandem repeat GloVer-containing protein [Chitinophagales bacterium]|nr:choice-of-anchor tandem repeat GloVer-containing protein [Chitinophagales bacterium]
MKTKNLLVCIILLITTQFVHAQNPEIWGTTQSGGILNGGTIFNMKTDGSDFTTVHNFSYPNGWMPMGNLLRASDGNLYGTCFEGGDYASCTLYRYDPDNGDYLDVYDFNIIDGDYPTSGVVEKDGILYGNSSSGGANFGGVIYSYDMATGIYTDIYDMSMSTGSYPYSSPIVGTDGKLYGVTESGGANNLGTIYSFDIDNGVYSDLYNFAFTSGSNPYGGLIQANDGKLYGMTSMGGANDDGVIYSFDLSNNTYENLYDFDGTNGGGPKGTLMQGNGKLYGLTTQGGANNHGVIFSVEFDGSDFTNLFDFSTADGTAPLGNLMLAGTILCGTTSSGGDNNYGTVFNFSLETGNYTKLLDFNNTNGSNPNCGFITLGDDVANGVQAPVNEKFSVYPNPVTQYAICTIPSTIDGMAEIIVTDVCGKEILTQQVVVTNSKVRVELGSLASGVYNLELKTGAEKKTAKLVKE